MRLVPALAVVVMAGALYVSGGVLDQIFTADGLVRVALLPPWQSLLGFVGGGALMLLWLNRRTTPRGTASGVRQPLAPLVLPAFAALLLVLPYLPLLPDLVPSLQVLAGPVRGVLWLVICAQLAWTLWQTRLFSLDWLQRVSIRQLTLVVALATACLCGVAAARLSGTVLYPGGDEPHYLVIAQSLWRDGDLKIENNHARGDYYEYFRNPLAPHYLTRGADGEIYSIHPVGMPVLIAPIYAAAGYHGVVFAFVIMAAFAAALMWRAAVRVTNTVGAATFAWAAVVATAPFLFNSFAVYPEIPAAVAVAVAFSLISLSTSTALWRWLVIGIACATLPWLSTKYAPMSATLVALALARVFFNTPRAPSAPSAPDAPRAPGASSAPSARSARSALAVVAPYAVSLAAWFYFFYAYWGVPLPQAPYGALVQTSLRYVIFGAPGLLFDQEYGLLPYAPAYILALTGLIAMARADAASRRQAIEIALVFAALLGTVGAFRIWWGGSAPPGRPVTSGLLLLVIPIAFQFRATAAASVQRAAHHVLLWCGIGMAGVLLFAQQGLLTANDRDGTSALLEYLSPAWPAWTMVPSFIHHETLTALMHSAAWLLLATAAGFAISRLRHLRAGAASLTAMSITAAALVTASIVMPQLPLSPPWPALDVRARPRLAVLDAFDTVARPIGIEYSPFTFVAPETLVTHAAVVVEPAMRTQAQPIRVLHNGRFSLPAGTYRIEIEWNGERQGEVIGLQIGRTGDPIAQWTVDARPGETWTREFTVAVDAPFVGLRGSAALERVIQRVRFVPVSIVNAAERPRGPAVLAASQSGPASIFYYDLYASPEREGFWVWGAQRTRVTLARPAGDGPIVLRVHSGPVANRLDVSKSGWRHTVELQPNAPETIEVPTEGESYVTLEFAAEAAFVPSAIDPTSNDGRTLGIWVEVIE